MAESALAPRDVAAAGLCIGCGICVAIAPTYMGLDSKGKAFARTNIVDWSPADGDFVHHCPTDAIIANYERHHLDALVCLGGGGTQKNALHLKQKEN